jgi:ABC-2 type transport system ATP-binding protein
MLHSEGCEKLDTDTDTDSLVVWPMVRRWATASRPVHFCGRAPSEDPLREPCNILQMENLGVAITVQDLLVIRGGRTVIDHLSVSVAGSSVTGLIGPSGCGKTTLIRSIAGNQVIKSGDVRVLGLAAGSAALRSRIGYVTQASSVYPDLSVGQNLRYFADLAGVGSSAITDALGHVGLADKVGALTGHLSGGERARVSLAAALLAGPEVFLLDEPTVGLDPVLRRDLWALFAELAASGRTLLVSSHVMDEAARCQQVLLMRGGRLIAQDTPDGLRASAGQADLEQAFLTLAEATGA